MKRLSTIVLVYALAACSPPDEQAADGKSFQRLFVIGGAEPASADADIETCEAFIRGGNIDPASYRRLSVRRDDKPITPEAYFDLINERSMAIRDTIAAYAEANGGMTLRTVTIESSASDFSGVERRRSTSCQFELYGNALPAQAELTRRLERRESTREVFRLLAVRGEDVPADAADSLSCCLNELSTAQ